MSTQPLDHDPFDALGDPNRRAIVGRLVEGDMSVGEIAEQLPISRPAVSRHLRLLKDAALVVDRPEGTKRVYSLHYEGAVAIQEYMSEVWGDVANRFKIVSENTRESG